MFRARRILRRRATAGTTAKRGEPRRTPEAHDEAPAPQPATDPDEQVKELAELREQGILTEEEFAAEKKKLLGL